jgi:hypothetical protein
LNAIEIEEAISELADQPFDPVGFPYAFLEAFGNKKATIDRLKKGNTNSSDIDGAVLQRNNIHIAVCNEGAVTETLGKLKDSPTTTKGKCNFVMATDGVHLEAEDLNSGETLACDYSDFPNKFAFFLSLAGITAIKQIKENSFDIRATSRLNKLYVELLKDNPDWATSERRSDMNHFMARLIFCFFAEDTDIFRGDNVFTEAVNRMSESNSSNTHEVIGELFRAMDTPQKERAKAGIRSWANNFPYVNGGLFAGSTEAPRFSKIARSYLMHIGSLDWQQINPDIFGSMIQAVADDEERGELGMHYTSVSNILKVLNPLFLDDLRDQLDASEESPKKLMNLRKRIAMIRVFDPACGSGNFLVIAYKEMRAIEIEINHRRGEPDIRSWIPLTNFRGIELRDFSAEVARLALIIAEYQCDVLYRGQKEALEEFLPLDTQNWITCGNAVLLNWEFLWGAGGREVKVLSEDLISKPQDQAEVSFQSDDVETYICGNPPYKGTKNQTKQEKAEIKSVFQSLTKRYGSLDYVTCWFLKAAQYAKNHPTSFAFVATNSICQGGQVPVLWPILYQLGVDIFFAYQSFKWGNLAAHNAMVTVIIVGLKPYAERQRKLFLGGENGEHFELSTDTIGPYLIPGSRVIVNGQTNPLSDLSPMSLGNAPYEGGNLIVESGQINKLKLAEDIKIKFLRPLLGSSEVIKGNRRYCFWIMDEFLDDAKGVPEIAGRIQAVKKWRLNSKDAGTRSMANRPHQFREMYSGHDTALIVPIRSSENRKYLPADLFPFENIATNLAYAIYDGPLYNLSIIVSRLHLVWISAVCGKLETRFSYSNKMGWHTFPFPQITGKNRSDLTLCAKDILLAREAHFPKNIADLYDPDNMPDNLREAHERNDDVLERIYIGRRFKNDTERLEKLFDLYTEMTAGDDLVNNGKRAS